MLGNFGMFRIKINFNCRILSVQIVFIFYKRFCAQCTICLVTWNHAFMWIKNVSSFYACTHAWLLHFVHSVAVKTNNIKLKSILYMSRVAINWYLRIFTFAIKINVIYIFNCWLFNLNLQPICCCFTWIPFSRIQFCADGAITWTPSPYYTIVLILEFGTVNMTDDRLCFGPLPATIGNCNLPKCSAWCRWWMVSPADECPTGKSVDWYIRWYFDRSKDYADAANSSKTPDSHFPGADNWPRTMVASFQ